MIINRQSLEILRPIIEKALAEALREYKISPSLGRVTFNADSFSVKVDCILVENISDKDAAEKAAWKRQCESIELSEADYGATIKFHGEPYKLIGINLRGRKFPFLVRRVSDGRIYKFMATMVYPALKKQTPGWMNFSARPVWRGGREML